MHASLLLLTLGITQLPSGQAKRTIDTATELAARPLDLVVSPDGSRLYVKTHGPLLVMSRDGAILNKISYGGASMTGLALSRDARQIYVTDAASGLHVGQVQGDTVQWTSTISMPKPSVGGESYPCGIAVLRDGNLAVALSRNNSIALVDPLAAKVLKEIAVDPAPYAVALSNDGKSLLASCWSVSPRPRDKTVRSSGTPVPITKLGNARSGAIDIVDLTTSAVTARIPVGLQPSEIAMSPDGLAYVAVANGDNISVVDVARRRLIRRIDTRANRSLPAGSAPNGVSLSSDAKRLYVALGGANAIAIYEREKGREELEKVVPTTWYPGVMRESGDTLYVGTVKGSGAGPMPAGAKGHNTYQHSGHLLRFSLAALTSDRRPWDAIKEETDVQLASMLPPPRPDVKPTPVPERVGEPSVFQHIVYILKENRTYDQVFGDMPRGDGDPKLVMYGREVTPNMHALADQFVLLDNFYCNGVLSADGHAWAMEGNATTYFERSFGGWTRSYPFGGDDPLAVSSSGFIWDQILPKGKSLRNFGEFDYADSAPASRTFSDIWNDFKAGKPQQFTHNMSVDRLIANSNREYPGWNLKIPDVLRASIFVREFREWERSGKMPSLTIIYLPQDHTSGTAAGMPTPKAMVADNDQAVGQVVDVLSHSRFWASSCVFVMEDDPQDGFDHVDGHRSPCLVVSPYTKRRQVVTRFYNQTSVIHTMLQILGAKPMTRFVALSPLMTECFRPIADLQPYTLEPNQIPLDQMNPSPTTLKGKAKEYALASSKLDLSGPDKISDALMNRILWHAAKGNKPYPAAFEGAHGKGLKKRGLRLAETKDDD